MGESPVAVVGTPGSGTRVFARLTAATGRDMGAFQSTANDALALFRFASKWCPRVYTAWRAGEPIDQAGFEADLAPCIEAHLSETEPGSPWGWKQPRSLYMLPALRAAYPELRVVHVIRDGRDVAFSSEPNVRLSGRYVLPWAARLGEAVDEAAEPVKAAAIWDGPNRLAADFGEAEMGDRYLRASLEEVCASPEQTAERLVRFVGGAAIAPERVRSIVQTPQSLGRWRAKDPKLLASIADVAAEGLRRFGYA